MYSMLLRGMPINTCALHSGLLKRHSKIKGPRKGIAPALKAIETHAGLGFDGFQSLDVSRAKGARKHPRKRLNTVAVVYLRPVDHE